MTKVLPGIQVCIDQLNINVEYWTGELPKYTQELEELKK